MAKSTLFAGFGKEPLQIFQDPSLENTIPMTSHAPMPSVPKIRRPLPASNAKATSSISLDPPSLPLASCSPNKGKSSSPRAPMKPSQSHKLNMVPMAWPAPSKGPVTDSLQKKQPRLSKFKIGSQKDATSAADVKADKENMCPIFPAPPPTIDLSLETCYPPRTTGTKRSPVVAAPRPASAPAKPPQSPQEPTIPSWDSFPPIIDDGAKPQSSYAQLIGMAILRSPQRRLTLSQIYKWISDHYSFYAPTDAGWQNSIRHNLSLHKSFIKIERSKDDPGKGNYWGIEPGSEHLFLKEKPSRKCVPTAENMPVMSARMEPSQPGVSVIMPEPSLPPLLPVQSPSDLRPPQPQARSQSYSQSPPQNLLLSQSLSLSLSQAAVSMPQEPSSDATIPLAENFPTDEEGNNPILRSFDNELSGKAPFLQSPLSAHLHSSPMVLKRHSLPHETPSCSSRSLNPSASRSHKRKFASMDDSGYISSLDSSAIRPSSKARLLTSEADRPRIKRGRAEEEIARLRGSSPFSPTRPRSLQYGPASSSPLRQTLGSHALFPLTPMVKMKPPVEPPPSVSPNTSLRVHRDKVSSMLQSPLRRVAGGLEETIPWSPAFHLDEALYACDTSTSSPDPGDRFDIFQDLPDLRVDENDVGGIGSVLLGSPVKRPVKRKHPLDRTTSTPHLGERPPNSLFKRAFTSAPAFSLLEDCPAPLFDTPSKVIEELAPAPALLAESPCRKATSKTAIDKVPLLELPGIEWQRVMGTANLAADTNSDYSGGVDILKGFQKIGASRAGKPGLGRSFSTAF